MKLHRVVTHIEMEEIPQYNAVVTERNNVDLRVKYMLNEISTEFFKSKIQQREKASLKKRDIGMLLNTFVVLSGDFYREIVVKKTITGLDNNIDTIVLFMNENMMTVSKRYDCMVPIIHNYDVLTTSHAKTNSKTTS